MNEKIRIFLVAGARPNFMKIAPLFRAIQMNSDSLYPIIIHTGQHYDFNMSDSFFIDLKMPKPDYFLGVGSGTHAQQTARIMIEFEKVLLEEQPDILIVVGDVNSTLACSIVASKIEYLNNNKCHIPFVTRNKRPLIVHVEAGLRSFDRTMPEEINRIVTDSLSDILFTTSDDADDNLINEGISQEKIYCVGNVMIDTLETMKSDIHQCTITTQIGLVNVDYGVVTLHRPSNVDSLENLRDIMQVLSAISNKINLVFPIHPRTRKQLEKNSLSIPLKSNNRIKLIEPLSYKEFMKLLFESKFVITDSGGLQEETTYLGIPCLTLRPNTERPITITQGTNELVDLSDMEEKVNLIMEGNWKNGSVPENWDGKTAHRIVSILLGQITTM